ncbi:nuclear transport factor 2 family protein [Mycobacterium sp. pUA109]|uniref:nuclear transport factor 2 family protein n=1 Tax=Mycobacterium sp. pUA109 TaxID=3238982 RepID=UPI00351B23D0
MSDERLADLERRLQRLEDERAIAQLIARYGPLVDAGDADAAAGLWAVDGSYDVEDRRMQGRDAVRAMVASDAHQSLIGRGSAHFLGPAVVTVDGDDAVAVCESVLFVRRDHGYAAARAAANHFRLHRIAGQWQIAARTTHVLDGSTTARNLLRLPPGR